LEWAQLTVSRSTARASRIDVSFRISAVEVDMDVKTARVVEVPYGPHRLHAEVVAGAGTPVVLMHGLPDNVHLYDRLMPHLTGRTTVRFDFLGWGRSDKPAGYPYTASNQVSEIDAVVDHLGLDRVVLVAHDGPVRFSRLGSIG
jgi:pimeloyl-ACP methyl ester carboxylesterase